MKTILTFIVAVLITFPTLAGNDRQIAADVFKNYRECFRFMARDRDSKIDDDQLFKLAAESSMNWYWLDSETRRIVIVIKLDLLGDTYSAIRGAQGNGDYYLFVPVSNGFLHVGTMWGNSYKYGTLNGKPRFIASAHMSAASAIETEYVWDGSRFIIGSKALFQYNPADGSKTILKDYMAEAEDTVPVKAAPSVAPSER